MNDFWLIGVLGGGAGAALGLPIIASRATNMRERWTAESLLGVWMLLLGLGMVLIGLRHGVVVTGAMNRVAEHLGNVVNLGAWPLLTIAAWRAIGRPLRWFERPALHLVPIATYLAVIIVRQGEPIRFYWLLPVSAYGAGGVVWAWYASRRDSAADGSTSALLRGFAVAAVAMAGAQAFRTFIPWFTPLREVVPLVATGAFLWIAVRTRAQLVAPRIPDAGEAPPTSAPRYSRSGLTPERAEALLRRLEASMEAGTYRDPDASLASVAAALGVTAHALSQALNQHGGTTFSLYMTQWRVKHARQALLDPAHDFLTIEAIASRSGFASRSAFYRAFREHHGATPVEYRARARAVPGAAGT